jgi:transcription elongation factor GreA
MSDAIPSLTEALTLFVTSKKESKKEPENHQELGRFVAWCGRTRTVLEVSPDEVAQYAHQIGKGGVESAQRLSPVKSFLAFWKQEGWIEASLAAHLRIPRARRGSTGAASTSKNDQDQGTKLSQEGYDNLMAQVDLLKGERVGVVADIKRAMEDKDFRENAPLDAAKERQGIIESRIRELEASLASVEILAKKPSAPARKAAVGTKVRLKDLESGKKYTYILVDVREADVATGKISTTSPVGRGLLDRSVGDEVTIDVPKGKLHYLIEGVAT